MWCVSVGEGKGCNRPHHKSLSLSHMVSFTATTSTDVIELLAEEKVSTCFWYILVTQSQNCRRRFSRIAFLFWTGECPATLTVPGAARRESSVGVSSELESP